MIAALPIHITDELKRQYREAGYFLLERALPDRHLENQRADTTYLFNEQYVIKCAEVGMKFAWHQDSDYVPHDHCECVSCWCAMDDITEENGTVYMLWYSRAGIRRRIEQIKEEATNDLVGCVSDDSGEPVICPAGSIAVFSSVCSHRSGANKTKKMRRVYLAQYSPEPIPTTAGQKLWGVADPFLKMGQRVV